MKSGTTNQMYWHFERFCAIVIVYMTMTSLVGAIIATTSAASTALRTTTDLPPVRLSWSTAANGSTCVAFRQTGNCDPNGPREPSGDLPCGTTIDCTSGHCPSGYCDCGDVGSKVHGVTCKPGSHSAFTCASACAAAAAGGGGGGGGAREIILSNGFTEARINIDNVSIVSLRGAVSGDGNFTGAPNALADNGGLRFVLQTATSSVWQPGAAARVTVLSNTSAYAAVRLDGVVDNAADPSAIESWTLALAQDERGVLFNTTGKMVRNMPLARAVYHDVRFAGVSIYGLFKRGVVQMRDYNGGGYFVANDTIPRVYAMGGGSAVDIELFKSTTKTMTSTFTSAAGAGAGANDSFSGSHLSGVTASAAPAQSVLVSNIKGGGDSGFRLFLQTAATSSSATAGLNTWSKLAWEAVPLGTLHSGSSWSTSYRMAPSNRNFPSLGLSTGPNLPPEDLEAFLTGIYGSGPGCLCTYDNGVVPGRRVAQISPTIARPDRGYSGTYNYFDPDNYLSLSAMLYSGDTYLQEQARAVFERSGAFLKPNGQLPHHFVKDQPQFTALSGATQTGPNTFWTKTALQYARVTGNLTWLNSYMPTLRHAAAFCFNLIGNDNLLDAPGSLFIDVFIRQHYTSDSNAMMVGFLREFAEAEAAVGNTTGATMLRNRAELVQRAAPGRGRGGDDHYITQLNPDNTTRDFVDYDANLIALAHGVPATAEQAARIFKRIDGGRCSANQGAGPQFVSEIYYGKQDTTHGNVGDSWCSMGRIALYDAHARKRYGDQASFDDHTLAPLQRDLIANTWMHERYGCDGKQQQNRTAAYFEYPSVVAMLLREIRYGINLGLNGVSIAPFGPRAFTYDIGNVKVEYAQDRVVLDLPGSGHLKKVTVEGLSPSAQYALSIAPADNYNNNINNNEGISDGGVINCGALPEPMAMASVDGILVFEGPLASSCVITVAKKN